jgi:hypothetical protein
MFRWRKRARRDVETFKSALLPIRRAQLEILANLDDLVGEAIQRIKAKAAAARVRHVQHFAVAACVPLALGLFATIGYAAFGWHPEMLGEPLVGWVIAAFATSILLFSYTLVRWTNSIARGDYGKNGETLRAFQARIRAAQRLRRRFSHIDPTELDDAAATVDAHIRALEGNGDIASPARIMSLSIMRRLIEATERTRDSTISNLFFGSAISLATLIAVGALSVWTFGPMLWPHAFLGARALQSEELAALVSLKVFLTISGQGLGFFYLTSYRRGQAETKYFLNELTSVETTVLSIELALEKAASAKDLGASASLAQRYLLRAAGRALEHLAILERNHVLKRGESTTLLAERKLDSRELSRLARLLRT